MTVRFTKHYHAMNAFKTHSKIECRFGSRITPEEALCWTNNVQILSPIIDKKNGLLCYLVDDEVRKVVGIAVLDGSKRLRALWVAPGDFKEYFDIESKNSAVTQLKNSLRK